MLISTVVCAHSLQRYQDLLEAVGSLLRQTYRELEIIVVIDGSKELYNSVAADYEGEDTVKILLLEQNAGISAARNAGIGEARGEVIAFIDDDAVADGEWIENLVSIYEEYDAIAVGGKILPVWCCERPDYLPEELYWLVGATYDGFSEDRICEVRNTFGANMSFRREVFDRIGGFNDKLGFARKGISCIQAEEPELALRMNQALNKPVVYNPHAVVYHKITQSKLHIRTLFRRAFYQGYSKSILTMLRIRVDVTSTERSYLRRLLLASIPRRIMKSYRPAEMKKLAVLLMTIFSVGAGFSYGYVRERAAGWKRR
jgi:glycosyltransferase involved in cell wall biosynthesis